jgi:hypothetical protein
MVVWLAPKVRAMDVNAPFAPRFNQRNEVGY